MRKTTGIIILIFVVAVIAIVIYKFMLPSLTDQSQRDTSDAAIKTEKIRICGDNYIGYWFLSSAQMRKQAPRAGLEVQFIDDGGLYADRLLKFNRKEYDCIVLPVNSYIEHGKQYDYPGVIVASISESKGGDSIIGLETLFPEGKVNELNDSSLTITLTGGSPSEFLMDLTIAGFGLDQLESQRTWLREVGSSKEVYDSAKRGEGDVFVLWEPDLSKALELPGMKYIFGSDKFEGYIVDVVVFHREIVKKKPEIIINFLRTYYRVMSYYQSNREAMIKDMRKVSGLKKETIEQILPKVDWHSLAENSQKQFGLAKNPGDPVREGLADTILACIDVMVRTGKMQTSPISNPFKLINSDFLKELQETTSALSLNTVGTTVSFTHLDEWGWEQLRKTGTIGIMRVEPIPFRSGTYQLNDTGKEAVDRFAQLLVHNYPANRVEIRGHTGQGNKQANMVLSQNRAETVMQYLKAVHALDPNRMIAVGVGAEQPPKKKPGESARARKYRMPRVEFILYESNPL